MKPTDRERCQSLIKLANHYIQDYDRINTLIHDLEKETNSLDLKSRLDQCEIEIMHRRAEIASFNQVTLDQLDHD